MFPWYENGNITDYLEGNPDVNQYELASLLSQLHLSVPTKLSQQLLGATSGLQFLHNNFIVHGALRPVREATLSLIALNKVSRAIY